MAHVCGDHRQRRLLVYCNLYYRWTVRASYVGNIALGGDHMQRRLLYIAIFTRTISCLIQYVANVGGTCGWDHRQRRLFWILQSWLQEDCSMPQMWQMLGVRVAGTTGKDDFCILQSLLWLFHASYVANVGGTFGWDHRQRQLFEYYSKH